MHFMSDRFLLKSDRAAALYEYAAGLPIFDYHCHLDPEEILSDRTFYDLAELWLDADHYKWRVMRAFGTDEAAVTGKGDGYARFLAFAKALPSFIGNPVYHWAHMELKMYFGITLPVCEKNAPAIWEQTKAAMADGSFSARRLIARSGVECVVTTDDPADDLIVHERLAEEGLPFKVLPCFRPDRAVNIEKDDFAEYILRLSSACGREICCASDVAAALKDRLMHFVRHGCTAADISFTDFPRKGDKEQAEIAFGKKMRGMELYAGETSAYKYYIVSELLKMLFEQDIVAQLHTGVIRNCNGRLFARAGADSGGDSVGNAIDIESARDLLNEVECACGLPKTIIYTLNPGSYYPLATLLGDFACSRRGKLQLGAAWWFMDHRDGIIEQLRITAATGGLGMFNGMLTDSRSFVSYARHDYFRRILCSLIAEWVDGGEYPDDDEAVKELIYNICIGNARKFFGGRA